jgi:primosomal protein N'
VTARSLSEKEEKIRTLLKTERGPLPLPQLLKLAQVTRSAIARMLRDGLFESWEEAIDPAEDQFDKGYTPPAHELNPDQENALKEIRARFELGEFGVQLLSGGVFEMAKHASWLVRALRSLRHSKM